MNVNATGDPKIFEVESESGPSTYLVDMRDDPQTCTCTAYAISRNRAGGAGYQGDCKHLREVRAHQGIVKTARRAAKKVEADEAANEFERIRVAASLQQILKDLT